MKGISPRKVAFFQVSSWCIYIYIYIVAKLQATEECDIPSLLAAIVVVVEDPRFAMMDFWGSVSTASHKGLIFWDCKSCFSFRTNVGIAIS